MAIRRGDRGGATRHRGTPKGTLLAVVAGLAMASGGASAEDVAPPAPAAASGARIEKNERLPRAATPPPAADDAAVMRRMLAATDTAVPIDELDDALVTTGSIAPPHDGPAGRAASSAPQAPTDDEALAVMAALPPQAPRAARPMRDMTAAAAERNFDASPDAGPPAGGASGQAGRILASVKLRAKPDNAAAIVSVLGPDAAVTVLRCDYWCELESGGKRGFVFRKFVTLAQPSGERAAEKQQP